MKVRVNQKEKIVPVDCTLQELAEILGLDNDTPSAIAIGDQVIARQDWASTVLHDNDKITIIRATCGG